LDEHVRQTTEILVRSAPASTQSKPRGRRPQDTR
jgi:hypothetical protein